MEKIYILDAVNFLFRSYYAIGPMTNKKGVSTSALYGFIRTLKKIIKDFSPNYLIAVFDGENNKMARQELYSEYKSHRKKAPDDLYSQIDLAYQFCEIANIPVISVDGVEADDTMASIAKWAKNNQFEVYLCTSDKDLCQMVDDQVFVLNVHKDNLLMNKEKVKEQFGVFPEKMLDYLAIVGDQSDNIPGIEGFGPKTAVSLLEQFSSLEDILANVDKVESKKRQEVLIAQKDLALLSKKLATLNTDVLIPQDKDSYLLKPQNEKLVEEFYQEMNFLTLLKEDKAVQKENIQEPLNYKLITTEEDLNALFNYLLDKKEIAIDTETTSLDPITAELVGIGLGVKSAEAFYIPFNGPLNKELILSFLKRLLDNENLSFYGHNLKYDYHILYNYGLKIKKICFDTILASYVLNPQSRRHGLDALALEKFAKNKIPITDLIGEGKKQISMQEVPIEMVCQYCCEDVDYTCRLKTLFENEIKENKLEHVLYQIELPLIEVLFKMERSGIFIDKEIFAKLSSEFTQELNRIEQEIFKEVGKPFNINSPKQLSQILYVDLGLTLPGKKGSSFSTAADVLEKLQENSPLVRNILKYRGLQKLLSTYVDNLPLLINPKTHRIHTTFNQSITATGRLSSQEPNLQNIPVRSSEGRKIREGFKPERENWSYIGADYSQIELRLLAHFSEDPELLTAFNSNQDVHVHTASLVFKVPINEVTAEMRQMAKTVNFGIIYGQGPYGLSEQLKIPMKEASSFINTYFERYQKVASYLEEMKKKAEKLGYAETLTGRKRILPEINSSNPQLKSFAQRLAINTPMQGTAADIIKLAMISINKEIEKKGLQGFMILQIHDELIFEVPDTELFVFKDIVKDQMENIVKLKVPLLVDIEVGKNWGEC